MKSIAEELPNLKRLMQMLAAQFGPNSEIILHDLSKDYSRTIVAIENNWITGRNVGDGGTNLGLEVLRNPPNSGGDLCNYFNKTVDGKMLRSSTFYFRNDEGAVVGSLCINTDITPMVQLQDLIQNMTMMTPNQEVMEVFANRVEDLFEYFIKQSIRRIGKNAPEFTMEDKIEIVRFLDSKGFFLITHASDEACKFLSISKFTLYKYLSIARGKNTDDETDLPEEDEEKS
jgi:predicted transcriptional regulator YheO